MHCHEASVGLRSHQETAVLEVLEDLAAIYLRRGFRSEFMSTGRRRREGLSQKTKIRLLFMPLPRYPSPIPPDISSRQSSFPSATSFRHILSPESQAMTVNTTRDSWPRGSLGTVIQELLLFTVDAATWWRVPRHGRHVLHCDRWRARSGTMTPRAAQSLCYGDTGSGWHGTWRDRNSRSCRITHFAFLVAGSRVPRVAAFGRGRENQSPGPAGRCGRFPPGRNLAILTRALFFSHGLLERRCESARAPKLVPGLFLVSRMNAWSSRVSSPRGRSKPL